MVFELRGTLAACSQPGYLREIPDHDFEMAQEVVAKLKLPQGISQGCVGLNQGLNPSAGCYTVGAYKGAFIVSFDEFKLIGLDVAKEYPEWDVMEFYLNEDEGFEYHIYRDGKEVRSFGASHGKITKESGEVVAEEKPLFDNSEVMEGSRYFTHDSQVLGRKQWEASLFGGTLISSIANRYFGFPLIPGAQKWPAGVDPAAVTPEEMRRLLYPIGEIQLEVFDWLSYRP